MAMTTTQTSAWAVPVRGDIGTLPSCRLRRVTEHIQQNLDKDLRLAELAALVYMSPYHFARLFKCTTGVPPHRFVVRQRIARASAFLATNTAAASAALGWMFTEWATRGKPTVLGAASGAVQGLSVAQISRMVGFRTPSHFTTVFRRVTGVTPRRYRTAYVRDARPGGQGE